MPPAPSDVSPRLISVNRGRVRPVPYGALLRSAIDKRPVAGPVRVGYEGLSGDEVADRRFHGGPDKAVYAYAREDLDAWERQLGRPLVCGIFGENLTTQGLEISRALIGELWAVGSVQLQVSEPRLPCRVFAGWMDEPHWIRRFVDQSAPGTYLRVVREGVLSSGDPIRVLDRPDHGMTIQQALRARFRARGLAYPPSSAPT